MLLGLVDKRDGKEYKKEEEKGKCPKQIDKMKSGVKAEDKKAAIA